jgi:hypothetical protein
VSSLCADILQVLKILVVYNGFISTTKQNARTIIFINNKLSVPIHTKMKENLEKINCSRIHYKL